MISVFRITPFRLSRITCIFFTVLTARATCRPLIGLPQTQAAREYRESQYVLQRKSAEIACYVTKKVVQDLFIQAIRAVENLDASIRVGNRWREDALMDAIKETSKGKNTGAAPAQGPGLAELVHQINEFVKNQPGQVEMEKGLAKRLLDYQDANRKFIAGGGSGDLMTSAITSPDPMAVIHQIKSSAARHAMDIINQDMTDGADKEAVIANVVAIDALPSQYDQFKTNSLSALATGIAGIAQMPADDFRGRREAENAFWMEVDHYYTFMVGLVESAESTPNVSSSVISEEFRNSACRVTVLWIERGHEYIKHDKGVPPVSGFRARGESADSSSTKAQQPDDTRPDLMQQALDGISPVLQPQARQTLSRMDPEVRRALAQILNDYGKNLQTSPVLFARNMLMGLATESIVPPGSPSAGAALQMPVFFIEQDATFPGTIDSLARSVNAITQHSSNYAGVDWKPALAQYGHDRKSPYLEGNLGKMLAEALHSSTSPMQPRSPDSPR